MKAIFFLLLASNYCKIMDTMDFFRAHHSKNECPIDHYKNS